MLVSTIKQDCTLRSAVPSREVLQPFYITEAAKIVSLQHKIRTRSQERLGFCISHLILRQFLKPLDPWVKVSHYNQKKRILLVLTVSVNTMKIYSQWIRKAYKPKSKLKNPDIFTFKKSHLTEHFLDFWLLLNNWLWKHCWPIVGYWEK